MASYKDSRAAKVIFEKSTDFNIAMDFSPDAMIRRKEAFERADDILAKHFVQFLDSKEWTKRRNLQISTETTERSDLVGEKILFTKTLIIEDNETVVYWHKTTEEPPVGGQTCLVWDDTYQRAIVAEYSRCYGVGVWMVKGTFFDEIPERHTYWSKIQKPESLEG